MNGPQALRRTAEKAIHLCLDLGNWLILYLPVLLMGALAFLTYGLLRNTPQSEAPPPELAQRRGITRSAAGVELWADRMAGAVVAIGNAPTALFRLLELIDEGMPAPVAVLGGPVGFVGSAQSKDELICDPRGMEYLVVRGRRGGSAMAAAAVNAIACERE